MWLMMPLLFLVVDGVDHGWAIRDGTEAMDEAVGCITEGSQAGRALRMSLD